MTMASRSTAERRRRRRARSTSRWRPAVTVFILAGRYFEARAKRRSGAALRALLELGAKDVAVLARRRARTRIAVDQLAVGDRFVVRPGREGRHRRRRRRGHLGRRRLAAHRRAVPVEVGPGDAVTGATVNAGGRLVVRATRVGRRHRAGPDRPAGRTTPRPARPRCSGWPTGSSAVFVPIVIALAVAHPRLLARPRRRRRRRRVHRRGRRADHRLPVRARAWPRRPRCWSAPAGAPSSASSSRARRSWSRPAGSTRSCSTRPAPSPPAGWRWSTWSPPTASTSDEVLRLAGGARGRLASTRSPGPSPPAPGTRGVALAAGRRRSPARQGLGVQGVVDGHAVVAGRERLPGRLGAAPRRRAREARRGDAEAAGRTPSLVGWDGAARAVLVVADTVKPTRRPRRSPAARPRAAAGAAHRRQRARGPGASPPRSASTR